LYKILTAEKQKTATDEERRQAEENRKKIERQARLAEWKRRKEAELASQNTAVNTNLQSSLASPVVAGPIGFPGNVENGSASPVPTAFNDDTDKPFMGKFDPKAIAKRATVAKSKLETPTLGDEVLVNSKSKFGAPSVLNGTTEKAVIGKNKCSSGNVSADIMTAGSLPDSKPASTSISTGFGLSQVVNDTKQEVTTNAPMVDMEDDEADARKKLERLDTTTFAPMAEVNTAVDNSAIDDVEDLDFEGGTEEEQAAAARAAAERRAAAVTSTVEEPQTLAIPEDNIMRDVDQVIMEDEEELDPLDAFMDGLENPNSSIKTSKATGTGITFDVDDNIMDAVGDDDDILATTTKKKKKEVPTVDHSKMKYEPFRKSFYTEPLELQDMSEEDVRSLRFELDDIKVQGNNVPKPVQRFAQFGLGSQALEIIRNLGFQKPTCIQAQAIPAIMSGRDVIGVAKTGSGKTVAFLLPMFRHIKDQRPLENMEGPIGLIMAPTRELATQIHRECKPYLKALNMRAVCASGGAPITEQIGALKRGAEIVVCTPGRLIDLLSANQGRVINLKRVTYVVMDEADRMFDMGFEPQITKVLSNIRPDKQCVLFSATFPRKMEGLARKELNKPVQITVGGRSVVPQDITQKVEIVDEDEKLNRTLKLIGEELAADDDRRALLFVERQETADVLLGKLQKAGYPCVSVHGGREQIDRDAALDDFKAGNVPVMVATSVAARGLDVKQLTLVINYDVPSHLEDYVHRCGRTGRAGNKGTAVTFISKGQDRYTLDIVKALVQSDTAVPEDVQKMADDFQEKLKSGTETRYGSGFGGKGLEKLDAQHNAELNRQRRAYGNEEVGVEEGEKEKTEVASEEPIKVIARSDPIPTPTPTTPAAPTRISGIPEGIDLDGEIKVEKYEKPAAPASNVGGASRLDRAAAAAALINSRLGAQGTARSGASIDNRGPDAGEYHYKLEINDFPQKARWAVTNRTNVAKILESTGVSITTKGRFYKAGEERGPDALPKMNVLVEGDTELQVTTAVRELQRLLREATVAASELEARAPTTGRYSVI